LIVALIIFALIWFRKTDSPSGILFLHFTAFTADTRLFLEAFRGNSMLLFGGVRLAQIVAWAILAVTFWSISKKQLSP